MPELSETVSSGFANYYEKLRVDLHTWAASLTEDQFWKNPFPYGNSVGHLVLHLTGNLNYYIGAQIAHRAQDVVAEQQREETQEGPCQRAAFLAFGTKDERDPVVALRGSGVHRRSRGEQR